MKKLFLILSCILFGLSAYAGGRDDALMFFYGYVKAANTYDEKLTTFYSPDAKIIRQVVKPDGTTVNVYTDTKTYIKQMKISQGVAKARKYTNAYSQISAVKVENGYKVSALRQPKGEKYYLKMYQVLKQSNGKWQIIEEMMQTKEQIFLKYAK